MRWPAGSQRSCKSRAVQAIAYSTTIFFHLIPGITGTSTRLPRGAPLAASAEAPELRVVALILLVVLVIGLTLQLRWLRTQSLPR